MSKSFDEIPEVDVTVLDRAFWDGTLPSKMAQMAQEVGPIFKWYPSGGGPDAGMLNISMVGPEANRFVMHTHRQYFSHEQGWTPFVGEFFGRGLLNMDDPEHAIHRKMWNPAFASAYMGAYLPVMQRVIDERTRQWLEHSSVDLYRECREITFDIAAAALAGFNTGAEVDRLREMFYELLHGFDGTPEDFGSYYTRILQLRDELMGMLIPMIHARREAPAEERPRDVLSMIVHARDDNGYALSDEQVLAHLNILLVAGHETTTTLSAWGLYFMSTLPEHRARLLEEVNGVPLGENDEPTIDSIRAMRTLDNFVRETGRLYSPVLNVPRGIVQEFEFGGYTVPAGYQMRLGLAACHRLSIVFENPDSFDPDRFAPPREEDKRTPYSLVTFGGGPRVCIGQHFANIETKALLAHVLRNYELAAVEGQHPVHAGFLTAFIPGGLHVRVRRKNP